MHVPVDDRRKLPGLAVARVVRGGQRRKDTVRDVHRGQLGKGRTRLLERADEPRERYAAYALEDEHGLAVEQQEVVKANDGWVRKQLVRKRLACEALQVRRPVLAAHEMTLENDGTFEAAGPECTREQQLVGRRPIQLLNHLEPCPPSRSFLHVRHPFSRRSAQLDEYDAVARDQQEGACVAPSMVATSIVPSQPRTPSARSRNLSPGETRTPATAASASTTYEP